MRKPTISLLATAGYAAAVLLLFSMALFVRSYIRKLQVMGDSVRHTNDVIERVNHTVASLLDLRPAARAFVATGNSAYRQQFDEDVRTLAAGYRTAQTLTYDNAPQAGRAARLVTLAAQVTAQTEQELQAELSRRELRALGVLPAGVGGRRHLQDEQRETVRAMMTLTDELMAEENRLLDLRRANARRALRETMTAVLLTLAVAVGLVILATWGTVANMLRRRNAQREQERLQQIVDLQAAREANAQFQERIMSVLGHDLRNPLTAIQMGTSVLLKNGSEPRVVGRLLSSAERMRRMIDQLLDFTRSRHGGIAIEPKPTDLSQVARRVIDELEMASPDRVLRLKVDGDACGLWDADRLEQVLSNLVGNAIRYSSGDADIQVGIEGGADDVTCRVHNDGVPIAPSLMPVIFDPFRRGNGGGSGGLGLGLFISREIVQAHGGAIAVASTASDGTTFSVVLPRRTR
jgi:signal transduction histidine kinase